MGRIAIGWVAARAGELAVFRSVDAAGSCTRDGDSGEYVYDGGEAGVTFESSIMGDGKSAEIAMMGE